MKTVIRIAASGLYAGWAPFFSGTVGSIWAVLIYIEMYKFPGLYMFAVAALFVLGFLVVPQAQQMLGKDSSKIVIDEIASLSLVYLFIKPHALMVALGFVLFRIFDIIKPPPARRLEAFYGPRGIMVDDLVAAFYTIAALFLINSLMPACILRPVYR